MLRRGDRERERGSKWTWQRIRLTVWVQRNGWLRFRNLMQCDAMRWKCKQNSGQIRLIYAQNKCELVQPATIALNVCVCNRWIVMYAIRLSMVPVIHLKLLIECAHTHTHTWHWWCRCCRNEMWEGCVGPVLCAECSEQWQPSMNIN